MEYRLHSTALKICIGCTVLKLYAGRYFVLFFENEFRRVRTGRMKRAYFVRLNIVSVRKEGNVLDVFNSSLALMVGNVTDGTIISKIFY